MTISSNGKLGLRAIARQIITSWVQSNLEEGCLEAAIKSRNLVLNDDLKKYLEDRIRYEVERLESRADDTRSARE